MEGRRGAKVFGHGGFGGMDGGPTQWAPGSGRWLGFGCWALGFVKLTLHLPSSHRSPKAVFISIILIPYYSPPASRVTGSPPVV